MDDQDHKPVEIDDLDVTELEDDQLEDVSGGTVVINKSACNVSC